MNRIEDLIVLLAWARETHMTFKADVSAAHALMLATVEGQEWLYLKDAAAIAKKQEAMATEAVRIEGMTVFERTGEKKLPFRVQVKEFNRTDIEYNEEVDLRLWAFENMPALLVLDQAKVKAAAKAGLLEGVATVVPWIEPKVTIPKKLEVE